MDRNSDVGENSLFTQPDKESTNNILAGNDMGKEAGLVGENILNNNIKEIYRDDNDNFLAKNKLKATKSWLNLYFFFFLFFQLFTSLIFKKSLKKYFTC